MSDKPETYHLKAKEGEDLRDTIGRMFSHEAAAINQKQLELDLAVKTFMHSCDILTPVELARKLEWEMPPHTAQAIAADVYQPLLMAVEKLVKMHYESVHINKG